MYKLLKQIDKVNNIKIIDDKLCVWQSNSIIYNDSIIYEGDIFGCDNYRQSFVIPINSGMSSIYINLDKKIKKELSYIKGVKAFINEEEILYNTYVREKRKRYITRINLLTEQKKWEIESYFGRGKIIDRYLYAEGRNNIFFKIDLNHPAQPLWQFDLGQLGTFQGPDNKTQNYKVEKIVGISSHNELIIACNNHCILFINIESGEIVHNLSLKGLDLYQEGKHYPLSNGFVYDNNTETMFSFYGWFYIQIDVETKMIDFFDVKNSLIQYDIISFRASLDYAYNDTHIFTIAERDTHKLKIDWMQRSLIAFNRKTKEIDWQYIFETGINTDTPKLAGNKLYQLDGEGNLHIFEKTKEDVNI